MRLGAMVVGILLALWAYVDALLLIRLGDVPGSVGNLGGGGVLSALLCGLAAMMVFPRPLVATVLFSLGAIASFVVAMQGYGDHYLYGSTMVALAVMSLLGWLSTRRVRQAALAELAERRARDALVERFRREQQRAPVPPFGAVCPACAHHNEQGSWFCARCGSSLSAGGGQA